MSTVVRALASTFSVLTLLALSNSPAYAQGGTTSTLSGVAVDSSGAVLPGADVTVTMPATGFTQSAVTNADGAFSFPGLQHRHLHGDGHALRIQDLRLNNVVLTLGRRRERERDARDRRRRRSRSPSSSASEIVQTQSSTVSSTINTNQISKLPLTTRSAMDFVTFLPGVSTPGGNRDATINGLPQRHDQHHARRRQHPGQHAAVDRRLLRHRQPAPRRDRRSHGDDGGAGRRTAPARARCRSSS